MKGPVKSILYFYPVSVLRIILYPVGILYGLATFVRNKLFDWNVLRSVSFPVKVISVGNLSTGGTGKTPHVEYLVQLLLGNFRVATLSRGYKRKSSGFLLADDTSTAESLGDEACQYANRYPDLTVAVDESRVHGVSMLMEKFPELNFVLLDDAYQHRYIKPGLSILLTDFYNLYSQDHLLPAGRLREFRKGSERADIIVVTKSPRVLSPITRQRVMGELKPGNHQSLYFSYIDHGQLTPVPGVDFTPEGPYSGHTALLFAGIANPYPLELYLKKIFSTVKLLTFPDHHMYTLRDVERVIRAFDKLFTKNKILVTTEKDMVRLIQPEILGLIRHLPVCYVPMQVRFHDEDREAFEKQIQSYVEDH